FGIRINEPVPDLLRISAYVGVNAVAQGCVGIGADNLKRIGSCAVEAKLVRQRKHVKDSEGSPHRRSAILKRVPRETNSRFEVPHCWIFCNRTAHAHRAARGRAGSTVGERLNYLEAGGWNPGKQSNDVVSVC